MAAISKITIDGFKAFPQKFELNLDGKNLLMYGENGSGKSSIYYALHALLQSQCKDKCSIYFSTTHPESIVNKYMTFFHFVLFYHPISTFTGIIFSSFDAKI
mgnify:CR=1 FL=1